MPTPAVSPPEPPHEPRRDAVRLQILATEHWSLLASRALAWNESFSRASMFLATVSGALVALALTAQASGFGRSFALFALAILPMVLFVGITTFIRMGASNYHDAQCVIGMNRIRAAYLEIDPAVERYFVMSPHDDFRGVSVTMGIQPGRRRFSHLIAATPWVVAALTSVVAGIIAALAAYQLAWSSAAIVACGVSLFVISLASFIWAGVTDMRGMQRELRPRFPSIDED